MKVPLTVVDSRGNQSENQGAKAIEMNANQINCTNCGAKVPAEHINIEAMVGKCVGCDHVFPFAPPQGFSSLSGSVGGAFNDAQAPAKPKSISKETGPSGELYLKRRWFARELIFLLIFCIAWDGFLIFWYSIAFSQPDTPWIMVVFPIGHLAVGVGLTYYVIAGLLNTTHVFTDRFSVIVNHRPLFWLGNKEINVQGVKRIMVQFTQQYNRNTGSFERFSVLADVNGSEEKLLGGLTQSEACYISHQLSEELKVDVSGPMEGFFDRF